ncbi:MAG TPA: hypothetical protein VMB22_03470 [Verrucomicrobiae bacterium]|nr:hypothetical protein [Verrucomicrobiae bacterium]
MKKRDIILIVLAVALAGIYVFFFTNWFKPDVLGIQSSSRFGMVRFRLDRDCQLTELKVVPLDAWETNQMVLPVWHLVSTDGSDPINEFAYGERIEGMDPAVEGARPLPLQPGVKYRMFITVGKLTATHDFSGPPTGR